MAVFALAAIIGCGSSGSSGEGDSGGKSVVEAKKELMETATKVEGPFARGVEDILDSVEKHGSPISVADSRIYESGPGMHKFAPETIAAYKRWRTAKLAESKD